jgi:hypothetical protein
VSEISATYIIKELSIMFEKHHTSATHTLAYISQVLINFQLQEKHKLSPATIAAANALNSVLSFTITINLVADIGALSGEFNGRNLFKVVSNTAHAYGIQAYGMQIATFSRVIADSVFDVIDGQQKAFYDSALAIILPATLLLLMPVTVMSFQLPYYAMPYTLTFGTFISLYSYYNTITTTLRPILSNIVSSVSFYWHADNQESSIKAISPDSKINKGAMISNNSKLYCLEVITPSGSISSGQYFCHYPIQQNFALLSANSYAHLLAERVILDKEAILKSILSNNNIRLDLHHRKIYRDESIKLDESAQNYLSSNENNALQYWCYDTAGKVIRDGYIGMDKKSISKAKNQIEEYFFAVSEIQVNRIWPNGRDKNDCLEIRVSLNDQYCDCECFESKGENPFRAWCDLPQQDSVGLNSDENGVNTDKEL